MRTIIYTLMLLLVAMRALSQHTISSIVQDREQFTPYYKMKAAGSKVMYLPMDYGKAVISYQTEGAVEELEHAIIARIDLVYSDYPAGMDLSSLTEKRLEALRALLPGVFSNKDIEFRKIRQSIGKTRRVASGLQHGFFIYYRPLPTKTSGKEEAGRLKTLLADSVVHKAVGVDMGTGCWWQTEIVEDTMSRLAPLPGDFTRKITRISVKDALIRHLISKANEKEYLQSGDSAYCVEDRPVGGCPDGDYSTYDLVDSTVTRVFKRHAWTHSFVISDVTGSMYPYTAQLLKWLQLNLLGGEKRYFMFFNDGDNKDDDKKVIGKTGGIYSVLTSNYDEVEKTIVTAMDNGSGGDAPENNIEALLASEKLCKDCDSIVMIADNWAPIKDISLLPGYQKPVKVVLCGVFDKINPDYLKLARDTRGSLHLIEEDIYTLSKLKEGETIKIHGGTYKLVDGSFVDVTPGVL